MQIIGKTDNGFILKASQDDLDKITDTYYGNNQIDFKIGTIFQINNMFEQAHGLRNNENRIKKIHQELNEIIEYTKRIKPIVAPEFKDENAK